MREYCILELGPLKLAFDGVPLMSTSVALRIIRSVRLIRCTPSTQACTMPFATPGVFSVTRVSRHAHRPEGNVPPAILALVPNVVPSMATRMIFDEVTSDHQKRG